MEENELILGSVYIVKNNNASTINDIMKIKIIDLTEKSIRYSNLDNEAKVRITKNDFNHKYKIIEIVNNILVEHT